MIRRREVREGKREKGVEEGRPLLHSRWLQ
jgi:hypothetical protein